MFGWEVLPWDELRDVVATVTGWPLSQEELYTTGKRVATLRQAFNLREGISPKDFKLPGRAKGVPPLKEGPIANVTVDVDTMVGDYYRAMDWDPETGKPSKKALEELGLDDVAKDLW